MNYKEGKIKFNILERLVKDCSINKVEYDIQYNDGILITDLFNIDHNFNFDDYRKKL